jgi:hypothetical protein
MNPISAQRIDHAPTRDSFQAQRSKMCGTNEFHPDANKLRAETNGESKTWIKRSVSRRPPGGERLQLFGKRL